MRCFALVALAISSMAPRSAVADNKYTVTLVSVEANRTAWGDKGDQLQITLDDVVQPNKEPRPDDGKNSWKFSLKNRRLIDLTCFDDQPLGASFVIQLDAVQDNQNKHIGKVTATLQKEKGELRLDFEMKHGKRTRRLRRRQRSGDETFWVTRLFPADASANYILRFKIEAKSNTR